MLSSRSLLVLLLRLLFLLVATKGMRYAIRPEEKDVLVVLHNLYRSKVIPEAKYMLKMYWDEELAEFAQAYAQKCRWEHNPDRGQRGENLYIIGTQELHLPNAVADWYNERHFYDFKKKTCQKGKICGHYTQIIWANTNKIGCGKYFCEKLQNINKINMYLLVCNYLPPGNIRGRSPYREGPQCSQCPSVDRCVNGLCDEVIPEDPDSDLGIEPVIEPEIESGIPSVMGKPNNGMPSNIKPTTEKPTMVNPTTVKPTTVKPTTVKTTTERMTTTKATTITTTMEKTTTVKPTTVKPTTVKPTTVKTTTEEMTTEEMTIEELTMEKMTTETMTTEKTTRVKLNNLKANKVKPTKVKPRKPNSAPDHVWSPFLGLLLLPPLVLAGTF
ncbi:peptidase inhibitor 16-like isoform X2 [Choloepus didactylus]|uniref:peptidase inhibitor 16-like isoform X2 n=1 Tax=Choloepus didactylus TaxID=27675 RepID=UPI00189D2D0C|nr:peptidase inhibitor 16-like isoform X2 [Choloepus didactylus]